MDNGAFRRGLQQWLLLLVLCIQFIGPLGIPKALSQEWTNHPLQEEPPPTEPGEPTPVPTAPPSETPPSATSETPPPDPTEETPTQEPTSEVDTTTPEASETPSPTATEETPTPDTATVTPTEGTETATSVPTGTSTPVATETPQPLQAPILIAPRGKILDPSPMFTWEELDNADAYVLEIYKEADIVFEDSYEAAEICEQEICEISIDVSLDNAIYAWRLRGERNNVEGEWSELLEFAVDVLLPPSPISPKGLIETTTVTLVWEAVEEAVWYEILVEEAEGEILSNSFQAVDVCDGTLCEVTPDTIFDAGDFTWQVLAGNESRESLWSLNLDFTIKPRLLAPVLISPVDVIDTLTPTFSWEGVEGATGYFIEVRGGVEDVTLTQTHQAETICAKGICEVALETELSSGEYSWRIRAFDAEVTGLWSDSLTFVVNLPLAAPTLISPVDTINTAVPAFMWQEVEGATRYTLKLTGPIADTESDTEEDTDTSATDVAEEVEIELDQAEEEPPVVEFEFIADGLCVEGICEVVLPDVLLVEGAYMWTARANDQTFDSPWSEELAFVVESSLVAPVLTAPQDKIFVDNPTFTWEPAEGATQYTVVVELVEVSTEITDEQGVQETQEPEETQVDTEEPNLCSEDGCEKLTEIGPPVDPASIVAEFIVEADKTCTDTVCEITPTPELELVDGTYNWTAQGANAEFEGPWSDLLQFEVITEMSSPILEFDVETTSEQVREGNTVTVNVEIRNVGETDALDVRLRNALASGLSFVQSGEGLAPGGVMERPTITRETGGDLVGQLDILPAGESATFTYRVRANGPEEAEIEAISDVLQLTAAGMEKPLVAEFTLLVVGQGAYAAEAHTDAAIRVSSPHITIDIPEGALQTEADFIAIRPVEEHDSDGRGQGLLVEFELVTLTDSGSNRAPLDIAAVHAIREADKLRDELLEPAQNLEQGEAVDQLPRPEIPVVAEERLDAALSDTLDECHPLVDGGAAFAEPFSLSISLDGLTDLEDMWLDRVPFVVVRDASHEIWVRQPLDRIDVANNTVVVEATHFSTWGVGIGGSFPENGAWTPLYDEARVSTFTGRAQFSYPIWVPDGRVGMTPSLALSYSSGTVDGVLGDVQSPWVGMGWSIDSVEITRLVLNGDCGGNCGEDMYGYADRYVLAFNGTSYPLYEDPQHPGQYHTEEESFLFIQRHNVILGNEKDGDTSPPNETDEWWEIVAADGTRYRLGWNDDSEQLAAMKGYTSATPGNPVLEDGPDGGWDSQDLDGPTVVDNGDGTFQMWYAGMRTGLQSHLGTAAGAGGVVWERFTLYDEDDVTLEAEEGDLNEPMVAGGHEATSNCGFVWTPENNGNDDGEGYVELDFSLDEAGDTYFWGRTWALSEFWFSVDGGTEYRWKSPTSPGEFMWDKVNNYGTADPLVLNLTAGDHTMRIRTKLDGSPFDAMIVTQDEDFVPVDKYCNSAPVMDPGEDGQWDDVGISIPYVLLIGDTYHMWYDGYDGTTWQIGYATSEDGENWTKHASNPVLTPGSSGQWDDEQVRMPSVYYDGNTYHMWYAGHDGSHWQIGYATSSDGVNWNKSGSNPVMEWGYTGGTDNWDYNNVLYPEVIKIGDTYRMWYVGISTSEVWRIGYATSTNGTSWTRTADPILNPPNWGDNMLHAPTVVYDETNEKYHLWFAAGEHPGGREIGYAYNTGNPAVAGDWTTLPNSTTNAWSDLGYAGEAQNRVALRWRVDRVTDTYGNAITYTYHEESRQVDGTTDDYDHSSYLDTIRYTGSDGEVCDPQTESCYEVRFFRVTRPEGFDLPETADLEAWDTWEVQYLDKVEVYALDSSGETLLRTYDLTLTEVQRQDSDGDQDQWDSLVLTEIVTTGGSLTAPKISFEYTNYDNRAQVAGEPEWEYPRLTTIYNGTGGEVSIMYMNDGRPADQYYAWRVQHELIEDGIHLQQMRTDYSYGSACYQDEEHGWCNDEDEGQLVGHEWTVVATKDFEGGDLSSDKFYFYTDEERVGRNWKTETRDSTGTIYFQDETDYATVDWTTNSDYPEYVRFTYPTESRTYERQGENIELVIKVTYAYDEDWGDLLTESLYDGDAVMLREVLYTYLRNDAAHLHSFLRSEITRQADQTIIGATYYAYDDTATGLGSHGALTLTQVRTLSDPSIQNDTTLDTTYAYDAYGNLTEERAHAAYGTVGTSPTDDPDNDRVTMTTYDTVYHTYPTTIENALGHSTTTTYDFQLSEMPLGLPRQVTDLNSATVTTVYDDLGRVIEIWQPGVAQANIKTIYPTVDGNDEIAAPFTIELQIWDEGGPGGDQYRHAWAFYDGLGRMIRNVGADEDVGQYIQSDIAYNALGLTERVSRSYEVTLANPPGTWSDPNWASPTFYHTRTVYDDFGRETQSIAPDGTTITTEYDGRTTGVIDQNAHLRESVTDDFGRILEIREYSGTGEVGDPYVLYTTTTYTYDTRDLLTGVVDELDNETSITYNGLGFKTSMTDPDMGTWSYTYNNFGQLSVQTDARGAQVRFTYDRLGRMTQREARMSDQDPWQVVASYSYDDTTSGNHGIGRQTGMSSVYESGVPTVIDSTYYDVLGRPTSTTRRVDGTDYTTQHTYDNLGRVLTTTLPTGEVITRTYNARGLSESVIGTDTYVTSTDYTPTGNVDLEIIGNGVRNDFEYEADSDQLANILTGKPAFLPLLDLTYNYDDVGNVETLQDDVRDETQSFIYDHLDRLINADVYAGQQMIEERYYTYDEIGNMLSFRHRQPAAALGRGVLLPGDQTASANYQSRTSFNALGALDLSSQTYTARALSPYVGGFGATVSGPDHSTRGTATSGEQATGSSYQGAAGFYSLGGDTASASYESLGVTAYVRGLEGGFGGWEPPPYTGDTGESGVDYTYGGNGAGPHAVTSLSDGSTFSYDANGNMITRVQDGVTWTYTFDAMNQLVTVSDGSTTTSYVYDGSGERIERTVDDGVAITRTLYVAGMEIDFDGAGQEQKRTIYYGVGGAFRIVGGENVGLYFRHTDSLGSTTVLSDAGGQKVEGSEVVYAPFGEVREGELSELTDFGFTGQRTDRSTGGLMYYGARYYLPELRRFISADSIVSEAMNSQALNRYSYVINNPINYTDPSGHMETMFGGQRRRSHYTKPKPATPTPKSPVKPTSILAPTQPLTQAVSGGGSGGGEGSGGGGSSGHKKRRGSGSGNNRTNQVDWAFQFSADDERRVLSDTYGVTLTSNWADDEIHDVYTAVTDMASAMGGVEAFTTAMGQVTIERWHIGGKIRSFALPHQVVLTNHAWSSGSDFATLTIAHEFGHIWDYNSGLALSNGLAQKVDRHLEISKPGSEGAFYVGQAGLWIRPVTIMPPPGADGGRYALHNNFGLEDWAVSFAGYVYPNNGFYTRSDANPVGPLRIEYIELALGELSY